MAYNPLIIIPGPAMSELEITDSNGNTEKKVWPVKLDTKAILNDMKSSLMKMILFRKDNGFSDSVAQIVESVAEPMGVKPDGSKKHNVHAVKINSCLAQCNEKEKAAIGKAFPAMTVSSKIGEENVFFFAYDMFGDVYSVADELDRFVCHVKASANAEKVDILCISLGGTVLKAYLDAYSDKNEVEKVISVASFMNGSSLIADIFEDKLTLSNTDALLSLMGDKAESLSSMAGMLPPDVIENTVKKSLKVLKENLILNCTMMWGCIPDSRFEKIYSSFIKKGSELDKKVSRLHNYSANINANLKALSEKGMKFYQICGCGKTLLPITASSEIVSDGIVDTALASIGAQCKSINSKPDAAACLFPENTWFFNNMSHFDLQGNDILLYLIAEILTGSVNKEKYPQFNGSRNIKNLRWNLIPKAKTAAKSADAALKAELEECISQYDIIAAKTVIENDDDVKQLEKKLSELLKNVNK